MIFTDNGIILLRQDFREADRIVSIYTQEHGRLNARVPSVSRPLGKLKALCEPFVCADYRIYVRRNGVMGTITGGKINSSFTQIRRNFKKLQLAFHFCELFLRLTPLHQPSADKFNLLKTSLEELEKGPVSSAFSAAFTLRLMMLAGFGLDHPVLKISPEFWQRMHEAPLSSLQFEQPAELLELSKCNNICERFLNHYLTYPLQTTKPLGLVEEPDTFASVSSIEEEAVTALEELPPLQPAHN